MPELDLDVGMACICCLWGDLVLQAVLRQLAHMQVRLAQASVQQYAMTCS